MKTVAILTPTYNRAYILDDLYKSLCKQTSFDFKWYIIDDGSTDDTKQKVKSFKNENFEIAYTEKENGGKHTALNIGIQQVSEPLTFIVDSDDSLTEDAIETIICDFEKYGGYESFCGLSYYKLNKDFSVVGKEYVNSQTIYDSYFNVRINQNISGDKAEVYLTEILKNHKFPVFDGEKFASEAIVWAAIAEKGYKLVFIPKGIYLCEYLPDGLTKYGRNKIFKNPLGYRLHAKSFMTKKVKFKIRCKYTVMYVAVSKIAKISFVEMIKQSPLKFLSGMMYPLGVVLYYYWSRKYR